MDDIGINIDVKDSKYLHAFLINFTDNISIQWTLYLNNSVVEIKKNNSKEGVDFQLNLNGLYHVSAEFTSNRQYFKIYSLKISNISEIDDDFSNYSDIKPIPYYLSNYPNLDIVLVCGYSCNNDLLGSKFSSFVHNGVTVFHTGHVNDVEDGKCLFSGTMKLDHNLLWGADDINPHSRLNDYVNCIGNYVFVGFTNDDIRISTDYFGTCKIYYYKKSNQVIISNRYHLLLLAMRKIGVCINLDYDEALPYISFSDSITNSLMDENCFVKDTHFVPVSKNLTIRMGRTSFEDSKISDVLNCKHVLSDDEYDSLLNDACEEIIDNLKCTLSSQRFDNYILDLTGGLDSRIVFAALTNISNSQTLVKINTFGSEKEIACASNIAEKLGYQYSHYYSGYQWMNNQNYSQTATMNPQDYLNLRMSCTLGTYFEPEDGLTDSNICFERTLHITGGCGELLRPYFSQNVIKADTSSNNYFESVKKHSCERSMYSYSDNIQVNKFNSFFSNLINNVDSSIIKKYEYLFLFENRQHFDAEWVNSYRTPQWMPNMSISAFKAFIGTIDRFKNNKFIFDVNSAR